MIITIDGPSGTGKTTIARSVAQRLKVSYFDTGAMFRALTYQALKNKIAIHDPEHLMQFLESFVFDIQEVQGEKRYFANGEDVTEVIRTPEVTQKVSEVAALGVVREILAKTQKAFGKGKTAVFEGRDMGTAVFPNAEHKFYLDARVAVRAERRYLEFKEMQMSVTKAEVLEELTKRDHFDSTREIAPLKPAKDAHLIDTSDLTIDQVIENVLALISRDV